MKCAEADGYATVSETGLCHLVLDIVKKVTIPSGELKAP